MTTPSTLPGFTNVMDNIPRVPVNEVVYTKDRADNGRRLKLRPEQKNVSWMMDLVQKFTKPGMLVLDPFAGTLSVAKACLSLNKHRRFIVSDADAACVKVSLPSLVLVLAKQFLNEDSDLEGNEEELAAARVFVDGMARFQVREDLSEACGPPGFPAMQRLPPYVLQFLANFYGEFGLTGQIGNVSPSLWPEHLQARFYGTDPEVMLAVECSALGVERRPSTIKHDNAGMGLFAGRNFGNPGTVRRLLGRDS